MMRLNPFLQELGFTVCDKPKAMDTNSVCSLLLLATCAGIVSGGKWLVFVSRCTPNSAFADQSKGLRGHTLSAK